MKLFVVADVHGHCSALVKALADAGFDRDNEEHTFLSCGDLFDRGRENPQVYDFVRGLPRKILLKGNHEDMLSEIFTRGYISHNSVRNGTDITVFQLLGDHAISQSGKVKTELYGEKIAELQAFLESMADYYETDRYVFTHGWLPILLDGRMPSVNPMWRRASEEAWKHARWLEWQQLYGTDAVLKAKTIVCGHRACRMGHYFDTARHPDDNSIFYGDRVIAIDAHTVRSGIVNVLVVDV